MVHLHWYTFVHECLLALVVESLCIELDVMSVYVKDTVPLQSLFCLQNCYRQFNISRFTTLMPVSLLDVIACVCLCVCVCVWGGAYLQHVLSTFCDNCVVTDLLHVCSNKYKERSLQSQLAVFIMCMGDVLVLRYHL